MTLSQRFHTQLALVASVVVTLSVANWFLMPEKANTWMISIGTIAAIWIGVVMAGRARPLAELRDSERQLLIAAVTAAGLLLAAPLAIALAGSLGIDGGTAVERGFQIGVGAILVLTGNILPKVLSPLAAQRCSSVTVQSLQRICGWAFVIAGFVYIAAWLFLPVDEAAIWAKFATLSAMIVVLAGFLWGVFITSKPAH